MFGEMLILIVASKASHSRMGGDIFLGDFGAITNIPICNTSVYSDDTNDKLSIMNISAIS